MRTFANYIINIILGDAYRPAVKQRAALLMQRLNACVLPVSVAKKKWAIDKHIRTCLDASSAKHNTNMTHEYQQMRSS